MKHICTAAFVVLLLVGSMNSPSFAQGKKKKEAKRFNALELPFDGTAIAISEPKLGSVVVPITARDGVHQSAAFCRIASDTPNVIDQGFLPEPPYKDPNDGEFKNGPSWTNDVNDDGLIVGRASTFEDDPNYTGTDISPVRGVVWTFNGENYEYEVLPTFNFASAAANGINSNGQIVGRSDYRAVSWDSATHQIEDLNTNVTEALGWDLVEANDINDMGIIVGRGILNGNRRGFLLEPDSGAIWAVPLIGVADANNAYRVNASGQTVGPAWNGVGKPYGTNPDYHLGYSWDGPGHDSIILGSITNNTSSAHGLNDMGESVGVSLIPSDDLWANDWVPTLWEPDGSGNMTATELTNEVAGRTNWLLTNCIEINNEGWISGRGRKRIKGRYEWHAVLLIPNQ